LCHSGTVTVPLIQTPASRAFIDLTSAVPQVMAAIKEVDGRYVYANPGFCHRLGMPESAVVGRTVTDLFAPELAQSYANQDRQVIDTGTSLKGVLELIVRADRSLGWYVTSKAPLADDTGSCRGIGVLSIDLESQLTSGHAGLASALAALRADVSRPWRLDELADIADLSPKQLQRLCRRTLGLSPQQLIQRLRIEEAVRLATTTSMSMGDIAAECGFYDQASFTRQFRKVLGLTPSAYRVRRQRDARVRSRP